MFQPMFLRELQRCQKVSMGPNILVGGILYFFQNLAKTKVYRYLRLHTYMFQCMLCEDEDVWYPPMEVEKDEYETLLEFLASCGFEDEAMFVDRYYKEDKNGPTSYYHLQVDLQQSGKYQSFSKFVFDKQ